VQVAHPERARLLRRWPHLRQVDRERRAAAFDDDMAVERAFVTTVVEDVHPECLADALQIDVGDRRVRRVANVLAAQRKRRGARRGDAPLRHGATASGYCAYGAGVNSPASVRPASL
jgi:hypothetical protein